MSIGMSIGMPIGITHVRWGVLTADDAKVSHNPRDETVNTGLGF